MLSGNVAGLLIENEGIEHVRRRSFFVNVFNTERSDWPRVDVAVEYALRNPSLPLAD